MEHAVKTRNRFFHRGTTWHPTISPKEEKKLVIKEKIDPKEWMKGKNLAAFHFSTEVQISLFVVVNAESDNDSSGQQSWARAAAEPFDTAVLGCKVGTYPTVVRLLPTSWLPKGRAGCPCTTSHPQPTAPLGSAAQIRWETSHLKYLPV